MGAEEKFVPGRLVSSTAGRDYGKFYLILSVLSPKMVAVVNGEERPVCSPKKKNIKHLKLYPHLATGITEKKNTGQKITDLEIKKALEEFLAEVQTQD